LRPARKNYSQDIISTKSRLQRYTPVTPSYVGAETRIENSHVEGKPWMWWFTPVIPTTTGSLSGRITLQASLG
jgi:hypothetical protein